MNKILKVGTGLASAVAALAMAFPVYALITNADVAANAGIQYSKLSFGGKITSANIKDGTITSKDIKGSTITSGDIKDETIQSEDIEDGTVTVADLAAGTLTATALADGSVTSAKILDATIANADVSATAAIAYSKLNLTGLIVTGDITADTILAVDIAAGGVATSEILDGTITGGTAGAGVDIAANTITAANIATSGVATDEILDGTILSADIFDGTITAADLGADSVAASEIADDAVGAGEIATSAVTTTEILDGTIAAADIASGAVTAVKLQSAAADLGAADVTVNLGNTNGVFNTNITTDGTMTAGGVYSSSAIFDGISAGTTLHIGEVFALGVALGSSTINTQVAGDLTVTGGDLAITGKSAVGPTTAGNIYFDTDDANLYVYDGTAWRDLTAGAAGSNTLDDAYNTSAGASTVLVDAGNLTFRSNAGALGDIVVDLNSTGDFILEDAGTPVITFSDTGNLTMASGTLALNGDIVTSDGSLGITGASGLTATATTGDASLIASAASVVIRGVEGVADAILLDADNNAAGGIDMDAGTGGVTLDTTGVLSLDAAGATNLTTSVGDLSLISSAGSAILTGAEAAVDAIDINASAGGVDVDAVTQFNVDVSSATGASNISVVANLDAEDLTVETTGTEGDVLINTADDFALGVAAGAIVSLADNAVAKTIRIGGVATSGTDTVSIATEGTAADVIAIGNANAATTLALTGGTAWSVSTLGLITTAGDLAVNGDDITSDGTLTVTGATGLGLVATLGNATLTGATDASVTGTAGDVTLTSGDDLLLNPADDITATLAAGGQAVINATTTANTTTTGVIDMDVAAGNAAVDALNIDLTQNTGADPGVDATAAEILLTGNDADGDMFGLTITGAATGNAAAGTYEAGISINNAENTAASMTDGILITATTDTATTDAIDVSDAELVNAINVGANVILGTTANIDLTNFDVTGSSGNIVTAGTLAVNGDAITADGALTVTGATAASLVASAGDANVTSTLGSVVITGNEAVADAIVLNAAVALGGIDITSNADIDITTTGADGEDITISNAGGSVFVTSTQNAEDSIALETATGGINITATNGGAGDDIDLLAGGSSINLTAQENAAQAIYLHANGGASETIDVYADQGTGAASVNLHSDAGGVTLDGGLATADAINITASNAAGGIDIDAGTGTINMLQTGTIAGNGVIVATTDAGISLSAVGAANGDITLATGDDIILNPTDDITATLAAAGNITVNATTTANTTTAGVIAMNVGAGDAAVDGLNIAMTQNDAATAGRDATAAEILLTGNDADGDMFGLTITSASTAASTTGTYEAGISIDNADTTAASMTDGILIASSGVSGGVVDAVDVSAANITNAINVGANVILGTTADINLDNFDVTGSTGDVVTAGDVAVNGGDITSSAATMTLNPTGSGNVNPGANSTDSLGASGTRWSTIFADTLNYSSALTDANTANTNVVMGNSNTLDNVDIIADTSINDSNWNVTEAGLANFVSVGAATPGTGTFTTLIGDTVQTDDTVSFVTNGESVANTTDGTFTFTRNTAAAVTITAADTDATVALTVLPGGAAALTLGGGSTTGITLTTDGTGNGELTLPNDSIADDDIDWGTGAGQVSGADITFAEGNMTDSTIVSADIKDGTIAGGDLAGTIAITTSGTLTSTGTVDFSGAVTRIAREESATKIATDAPAAVCNAASLGSLVLVDENDAANVWLWACEETTDGAAWAWGRIN